MNRYKKTFNRLKQEKRIAFVPFALAGDPNTATSEKIFQSYIDAGADILEIGYPFSDPIADGQVNQRAAQRAINSGLSPSRFFSMIKKLRSKTDIPFGLLLYSNTVNNMGYERFCAQCSKAGIDSLLVADMPPEESVSLLETIKKYDLKSVFIVSQLTPMHRIRFICKNTTGFIYLVSRLGTTGVQKHFGTSVRTTLSKLRSLSRLPVCVGFGISSPQHVAAVASAGADGAIVGSALVKIIERNHKKPEAMLKTIIKKASSLRAATES